MQFSVPLAQPARAKHLALSIALIIVIGTLLWLTVSNVTLEIWASADNRSLMWDILNEILPALLRGTLQLIPAEYVSVFL